MATLSSALRSGLGCGLLTLAMASPARAESRFIPLGDLPGGAFASVAHAVSNDGTTVVGAGESASGQEAFRWTTEGGMQELGDLPGGAFQSVAYGVSVDGAIVVGGSASANGDEAFRWSAPDGMTGLGDLQGGAF
jgi:probable HAF family extracellular repeat protein